MLQVPATIERFTLGRELGRGAFGAVFEAIQRLPDGSDRKVALKVQHGAEALEHEARIAGQLRHRNIVDVYEVGTAGAHAWCAMELCPGGSLAAHRPLPPRALVEVGVQICAALEYAHEALELVHRDIKPENLLLDGATVKLGDLGISSARGFDRDGRVSGTPAYMAPEQHAGGPVDARTDLYALARTLYRLAQPDQGDSATTFDSLLFTEPPDAPLPANAPMPTGVLPESLVELLDRAVAHDPDQRWPSAAALGAALAGLSLDGPGLAEALGVESAPGPQQTVGALPPPARLYGRTAELATVAEALAAPGLVTLRGPAGIGKSRIAYRAARGAGCPVCHVDVSSIRDAADLLVAVGRGLGVPLDAKSPEGWAAQLGHALAEQGPSILLLDGLASADACRATLERWLHSAPDLRVLVTTRQRLGADSERVLEIGPLHPDAAVALVQRRAARRGIAVDDGPAVRGLVGDLDGIPLALELAAGRLGVLDIADVRARLAPAFLRGSATGDHETLEAALDASWQWLSPAAQLTLCGLSVFEQSTSVFDLAEIILGQVEEPAAALEELHGHSLVTLDDGRWRLLGQVRAYAAGQRSVLGVDASLRHQHARMFALFGSETSIARMYSGQRATVRTRFIAVLPELIAGLRSALELDQLDLAIALWTAAAHAMDHLGQSERALEEAGPLVARLPDDHPRAGEVHQMRALQLRRLGRCTEVVQLVDDVIHHAPYEWVPKLELVRASALYDKGELTTAEQVYREAMALFEADDDPWFHRTAQTSLANTLLLLGRIEESRTLVEASLASTFEDGDLEVRGVCLGNLGNLLRQSGDLEGAASCYEQALELYRSVGERRMLGHVHGNVAYLYRLRGDLEDAIAMYDEAIDIARRHGERYSESVQLVNRGIAWLDLGDLERALADMQRSGQLAEELGLSAIRAYAHAHLGRVRARQGAAAEARPALRRALATLRSVGDPLLLAEGLSIEAEVTHLAGDSRAAQRLIHRAAALLPPEEVETRGIVERVRALITDAETQAGD